MSCRAAKRREGARFVDLNANSGARRKEAAR